MKRLKAGDDGGGPWPIAVIQDRYEGCYSGGAWLAISVADRFENGAYRIIRCIEGGPSGDDVEAREFWLDPPSWIAVGQTSDEAVHALQTRLADQDEISLSELDRKIAEGSDDLDAGRVHTADEVATFLKRRFGRTLDAAE